MTQSTSEHWDAVFSDADDSRLGWYESDASVTLRLLDIIPDWKKSTLFLPGAGTSVLIDELLASGAKLILNDISEQALNRVKNRLGDQCSSVEWLCQDIAKPVDDSTGDVDLWIDRAVLHFLTDDEKVKQYFDNLKRVLKVGGHAVFAEFSKKGATQCAGLPVRRYSVEELSENMGPSFRLIASFDHTYVNPQGDSRPYIYTLYKRDD